MSVISGFSGFFPLPSRLISYAKLAPGMTGCINVPAWWPTMDWHPVGVLLWYWRWITVVLRTMEGACNSILKLNYTFKSFESYPSIKLGNPSCLHNRSQIFIGRMGWWWYAVWSKTGHSSALPVLLHYTDWKCATCIGKYLLHPISSSLYICLEPFHHLICCST